VLVEYFATEVWVEDCKGEGWAKKEGHDVSCPYKRHRQECLCYWLVDIVLLPVESGVGLDDDVFVCGLL
jgi:hypothetical protein